ncbi:tensin-1-like isoform X7 [Macrobrachium nipponense]|uniref:tensin-1-like isoform X7 n=1 Tax=Macrobrachium nipponense TaxID=159736 RepID=UPI0030C7D3D6
MFVKRLSGSFNGGTYYTMEDRVPEGGAAEYAPRDSPGSPEAPLDQGPDAAVVGAPLPGSDGDHEEQQHSRGRKATWEDNFSSNEALAFEKQLDYDDDGWQIKKKRKKKKKEKETAPPPPPSAGETSSFSRIKSRLRGRRYGGGKKGKEGRTCTLERVEEEQTLRAEEGEQEIVEVRVISKQDQENRPPAEPKILPNKEKLSPLREMFLKVVEDKAPVKERRRSSLQLGKSKKKKSEERVEIHFDTKKSESEPCLLLKAAAQTEGGPDCARLNVKKGEMADESWVFHQAKPDEKRLVDDDHLDYADAVEPGTVEAQRHVFKAKKIKKSRPCHVCHQPVVKLGSCCRVCKYLVHKACEPKEAVVSEAPPVRSFTDPARQIFHELRIATPGSNLRGPSSSLQGSPRSPRRPGQGGGGGGTAPPSLQPSPTPSRRGSSPSDVGAVHGYYAGVARGPGGGGGGGLSKTPPRDGPSGSPRGTPKGSPSLSARRSVSSAADGSYVGRGASFSTREVEHHQGIRHVPNNNEAALTQRQPTISSRNTQSEARLNRVMAGSMGLAGSGGGGNGGGGGGPKMDVVYVTEKIISLAFPPNLDDATYTLHLREVAHMLSSKHGDNFKVFNLSQHGEISHFLPRVLELGWADHLAPALERLCSICKALDSWITQHPQHVAVLHARGGYEKLGVVIAAYMHYSNICASTDQALDRYAMKRFFDDKIGQLYHPSQKRYVQYFAGLLSGVIRINSSPLYLHTLTLYGIPHFEPTGGCHLFVKIYQGMTPIFTSGIYNLTETMRQVTIVFETVVQLRGDILLKAYHRRLIPASREVIFRIQFHTCAVSEKYLSFTRHDLDDACNDMRFPLDGSVELFFTHSPDERPQTVSNVSCDKSPCAIASWNSYENISLSYSQVEDQGMSHESRSFPFNKCSKSVGGVSGVSHTLGPLDGSLYATVTKKRPSQQQQQQQLLQQQVAPPPHSPVSPNAPPSAALTPSPHGLVNGRYAASIDSGIASSNSAGAAPVSPPTSDTSRASGDSRGTAAAVAEGRVVGGGGPPPPLVDARQLDELLQGMLLDIQSIPDLRPSQTPAPDIDSIRCPDFGMAPKAEPRTSLTGRTTSLEMTTTTSQYVPPPPLSPVNGYSGSTTHDSLLDSSLSTTAEDLPYHARTDSKPFSYGAVTSSPLLTRHRTTSEPLAEVIQPPPPASPSIHRRNSRETLSQHRAGLESPSLVRRMSGSMGGSPPEDARGGGGGGGTGASSSRRSPSPSPEPGSRGGTLQRQRSHTLTSRIMAGEGTPTSTLTRSEHTRSASRLDDSLDLSYDPHSRSFSSTGSNTLSWLQMQQRKLAERREAKVRAERGPQEARMLSELRTRMNQQQRTTTPSSRDEDGYVSDTTLLSETSRESSPVKTLAPLTINTGVTSSSTMPQKPPIGHSTPARGNSAPSSPILPTRSASRERTVRYNPPPSNQRSLPRKHSDTSHDRERPFVAVKRAHENAKTSEPVDSSSALSQLQTSPHGHINYTSYASSSTTDGLLTTVVSSSNQEGLDSLDALSATLASLGSPTHPLTSTTSLPNPLSSTTTTTTTTITTTAVTSTAESRHSLTAQTPQSRDDSAWQSDTESSFGGTRPITPGFPPATPTTPYLNQGLPPKSPTMQRRAHLGLSSLSSRPTIKKSASLPSKEMGVRSPSPATSQTVRQELNGHSSPAPSLYHGQSRRSSLTSLNESTEVISSHPKFVKDISKFWYKPTITRDEAINMLKDKAPGTFVVRDSNSFPGAFGLALKVSTPPPNVTSKSGDPASELVRHFLIEPTSRGVRLKGCANEPVFGSLSALVYQHSITALALPCRLMLPERDPAGVVDTVDGGINSSSSGSTTTQLLQQGAACNVLYLHTADTESLTGPQAVKRAVSLMLAAKVTPTVVHFKVSAQGITLTDNERKLFFRRHYPVHTISHCGLDPDDRRWAHKNEEGSPLGSLRVFGFVAKKGASRTENQCHILAELEPEQPATAICNFVTKVMMTSVSRPNLV